MKSKLLFIASMIIFGTVGLPLRAVSRPPIELAFIRGFIGCIFLLLVLIIRRNKPDFKLIKKNVIPLCLSGIFLAFNWIFLFLAYNNTTYSNAALSVYFAPVIVLLLSPLVLKEKFSLFKFICIITAVFGMFLAVGNCGLPNDGQNHLLGITFGLATALFYAAMMLTNKFIKGLDGVLSTFIQLFISAVVLLPVVFITEGKNAFYFNISDIPILILLGVVYSGLAFFLFITGMQGIKGHSIAALNYLDPLTSLFVSCLILNEVIGIVQLIGCVLLLGSTLTSELRKFNS